MYPFASERGDGRAGSLQRYKEGPADYRHKGHACVRTSFRAISLGETHQHVVYVKELGTGRTNN